MKTIVRFAVLLTLVLQPGFGAMPSVVAQDTQPLRLEDPQAPVSEAGSGMPGWPVPAQAVPHHEPGGAFRGGSASYPVTRLNAQGQEETIELTGLDALLANGTLSDPLQGSYRLVSLDKILFGSYQQNSFEMQTYTVSPTISVPGSQVAYGDFRSNDIAAGDLNGDLVDEQLAAWIDPPDHHIYLDVGEMRGVVSNTKTTSPPAAVLRNDDVLDLVVRGYDTALWHRQYDLGSDTWGAWSQQAGGLLLSGPAITSRGANQFDVYAIGIDDEVTPNYLVIWANHWENGVWGGWVALDDPDEANPPAVWPTINSLSPTPLLLAPAVVTRSAGELDLFWLWSENTLRWRHFDGSAWGEWQDLGGFLATGPGAVSLGTDQMAVFAGGVDGALWQRTYDGGWEAWERLPSDGLPEGITLVSPPAAISPASGHITVYVRASDNQLWQNDHNGAGWGGWTPGGGLLASGVGAAFSQATDTTYLYAQDPGGSLGGGIATAGGAPTWQAGWSWLEYCCLGQPYDTEVSGYYDASSNQEDYLNNIDLESGYFVGDGREQIALAYRATDAQVALRLYDIQDGFSLQPLTTAAIIREGRFPKLSAGDFDDDGVDEIALFYFDHTQNVVKIEIFSLNTGNGALESTAAAEFPLSNAEGFCEPAPIFLITHERTFNIEAGDLNGDGDEEIAVSWDAVCQVLGSWIGYQSRFSILDVANNVISAKYSEYHNHIGWDDVRCCSADIELALGDVDGNGVTDIVRTWPWGWDDNDWPDIYRNLQVLEASTLTTPTLIADLSIPGWTRTSWRDELAVGDLNRDLVDEIVFYESDSDYSADWDKLWVYQYEGGSLQAVGDPITFDPAYLVSPRIVTGDFTGESVRVGAPTYRVQNRVDTLVSVINMPPRHRDLVKDANDDYQLIVSPNDTCTPTAGDPNCTHAKYATSNFDSAQQTLQSVHAYSISAGMESKACASTGFPGVASVKTCVTNSIDYTHGGNFEKTTDTINSINFESTLTAADDDKLVFYGTPYAVWEYPVLSGTTSEADGFITVAFPLIKQTRFPGNDGGYLSGACDEEWYTPGHQLYNVWSYDPYGALTFEDYDDVYEPVYDAYPKSDWDSGAITYSNFQSVLESSTFKHAISAGTQVEVEAEAKIKVVDLEGSFKAYINGSYENTSMQSDVFSTQETTEFSYFLGPQPDGSKFNTRVVFYWAKDGYQVLNYQTEPGNSTDWEYYDKADPAFILPWYGFPDPVSGQIPQSPDPDAPPCGWSKQLLSPDLEVSPRYASVGETVVISATVRNFSNVAPGPFTVKFYQGDPSQGGVEIGQDTIENLARYSGPKTAQISWTASGAGRQKIFAVIDPGGNIPEVHDEDDWIDNNTAYTNIEIGSIAYTDRGVVEERAYQGQSYKQSEDVEVAFYLPSANLEAVSKFELKDSDSLISGVGRPFELAAYQGSDKKMWDKPIPDFDLAPERGSPPAVLTVAYSEAAIGGHNESNLRLYWKSTYGWEEAYLSCGLNTSGAPYAVQHFEGDNLIAVPVCKTGEFVLSDTEPKSLYLPMIRN